MRTTEEIREIERHKYFLSEKAGHDVGWEAAERDWEERYGASWREAHADLLEERGAQNGSGAAGAQLEERPLGGETWAGEPERSAGTARAERAAGSATAERLSTAPVRERRERPAPERGEAPRASTEGSTAGEAARAPSPARPPHSKRPSLLARLRDFVFKLFAR